MTNRFTFGRRQFLGGAAGSAALVALGASPSTVPALAQDTPKITIWAPGDDGNIADWDEDPILQAVEAATGVDIEIIKQGWDIYQDQIAAAVASGEVPDIIATYDNTLWSTIGQWVRDGVVTPYAGDNASAEVTAVYEADPTLAELKVDDEIYMSPVGWGSGTAANQGAVHVRKDLLDKYGLDVPDTFEAYFDYLRAAKEDGLSGVIFPGGGTAGLGASMSSFAGAFGLPHTGWVKTDDGYEFAQVQPGMKDALILFRQMVEEGLVDPTSFEITDSAQSRDRYVSGAAASYIFNGGGHIGRMQNDMLLVDPSFQEWVLPALDAGAGSRGYTAQPRFSGGTFLGSLGDTNPTAASKVVDYLLSEEGTRLTALGIEGRDWQTNADGEIELLQEQRAKDGFQGVGDTGAHPLASGIVSWVPQEWQDFALLYGKDEAFKQWYADMNANQQQFLTPSVGLITTSPLWTDFQSTSQELITRSFIDIVQSGSDEEAGKKFDAFVEQWNDLGGADATAEMNGVLTNLYG